MRGMRAKNAKVWIFLAFQQLFGCSFDTSFPKFFRNWHSIYIGGCTFVSADSDKHNSVFCFWIFLPLSLIFNSASTKWNGKREWLILGGNLDLASTNFVMTMCLFARWWWIKDFFPHRDFDCETGSLDESMENIERGSLASFGRWENTKKWIPDWC